MKTNLRFVCDTNIFVSYLLAQHSPPAQAVEAVFQEGVCDIFLLLKVLFRTIEDIEAMFRQQMVEFIVSAI